MIGGGIEDGENQKECIIREIKEELNSVISFLKFFRLYSFSGGNFYEVKLKNEPDPNEDDLRNGVDLMNIQLGKWILY